MIRSLLPLRPPAAWFRSLPVLALSALTLAGCGTAGDTGPRFSCPRVVLVDDADRLTRFAGQGRDLTDVDFEAEIMQLAGSCGEDDGVIDVDLQIRIVASRGPADDDRRAPFAYFVAITDADERILARESFETAIEFPGNATRSGILERVAHRIPLPEGETGAGYAIYVGFELSREEFDYNRRRR